MAELHIDDDWKKQAQEEKRRLVEQEAERAAARTAAAAPAAPAAPLAPTGGTPSTVAGTADRDSCAATFATIVQSLWTQAMLYLGELAPAGAEPMMNLDKARQQFDLLAILEAKTKGNLDEQEQHLLDAALYETSSRFINVASQFI